MDPQNRTDRGEATRLLEEALERRCDLRSELDLERGCWRLVNGEGDGFDGLTVDRYGDVILVEQHLQSSAPEPLIEAIPAVFGEEQPIVLKLRYSRDEDERSGSQSRGVPTKLDLIVDELGLKFGVHLTRGEHTGLFLDSRPARQRVRALSADRRVLNLFSYTGGFGVAAAVGGAKSTTNVDNKRSALDGGRRNYDLNGVSTDSRTFMKDDAILFLNRAARGRGRYDLVIVDPPPRFRRKGGRLFDARRGYGGLVARCMKVLEPGGLLLAGLNARAVDDESFQRQLEEATAQAQASLEPIERIDAGLDFPAARGRPAARFMLCRLV